MAACYCYAAVDAEIVTGGREEFPEGLLMVVKAWGCGVVDLQWTQGADGLELRGG